ncbi:MAG: hypothetical protein J2P36_21990 [Ktedonobacteraceae bacterium]|nr:hypothetical protein [Ktedonobacteraceae bacterium]
MDKFWDKALKRLAKLRPQHIVQFLSNGQAEFVREYDSELQISTREPDLLYNVSIGGAEATLHIEFQRRRDGRMDRRVWEYNVAASLIHGMPVYSYVLYLIQDGPTVESPYRLNGPDGKLLHVFHFENVKLWEIDGSALKQTGLEGLLPLLPLTQNGARREVAEEMMGLLQDKQRDLLALGLAFAGQVLTQEEDKQWLKARFSSMQEFFEENWVVQEWMKEGLMKGLKEGKEEGLKEGEVIGQLETLQAMLPRVVDRHFPELAPLARQALILVKDVAPLRELLGAVIDAQDATEARIALEKACHAADSL